MTVQVSSVVIYHSGIESWRSKHLGDQVAGHEVAESDRYNDSNTALKEGCIGTSDHGQVPSQNNQLDGHNELAATSSPPDKGVGVGVTPGAENDIDIDPEDAEEAAQLLYYHLPHSDSSSAREITQSLSPSATVSKPQEELIEREKNAMTARKRARKRDLERALKIMGLVKGVMGLTRMFAVSTEQDAKNGDTKGDSDGLLEAGLSNRSDDSADFHVIHTTQRRTYAFNPPFSGELWIVLDLAVTPPAFSNTLPSNTAPGSTGKSLSAFPSSYRSSSASSRTSGRDHGGRTASWPAFKQGEPGADELDRVPDDYAKDVLRDAWGQFELLNGRLMFAEQSVSVEDSRNALALFWKGWISTASLLFDDITLEGWIRLQTLQPVSHQIQTDETKIALQDYLTRVEVIEPDSDAETGSVILQGPQVVHVHESLRKQTNLISFLLSEGIRARRRVERDERGIEGRKNKYGSLGVRPGHSAQQSQLQMQSGSHLVGTAGARSSSQSSSSRWFSGVKLDLGLGSFFKASSGDDLTSTAKSKANTHDGSTNAMASTAQEIPRPSSVPPSGMSYTVEPDNISITDLEAALKEDEQLHSPSVAVVESNLTRKRRRVFLKDDEERWVEYRFVSDFFPSALSTLNTLGADTALGSAHTGQRCRLCDCFPPSRTITRQH